MVKITKTSFVCFIIILLSLLFSACNPLVYLLSDNEVGNGDWGYALKNGYEIHHINSESIICKKDGLTPNSSYAIRDYITRFYYNDENAYFQYLEKYSDDYNIKPYSEFKYAIIIFETDDVIIYDSYHDFKEQIPNDIPDIDDWIKTKPAPNGANYGQIEWPK